MDEGTDAEKLCYGGGYDPAGPSNIKLYTVVCYDGTDFKYCAYY